MVTFFAPAYLASQLGRQVVAHKITSPILGNLLLRDPLGFSTANSTVEIANAGQSVSNQGTRATQFNISPRIGYFVAGNFAIGIGLDYTLNEIREPLDLSDPDTEYKTEFDSDLLFGPFARYYIPVGTDKAFFLQANFGFGSSEDQIQVGEDPQTISNDVLAASIGPGFTIYSTDAIGIEAIVKYNWARSNATYNFQGESNETTTFTNQLDFSIGFQVYFTRLQRSEVGKSDATEPVVPEEEKDGDDFY